MSALATASAVLPDVPSASAGAEYAPPLVQVFVVSPGHLYELSEVTCPPTVIDWPYQPSGIGMLIPLVESGTEPLSIFGLSVGSDCCGSGVCPPDPPPGPPPVPPPGPP